MLGAPFTGIKSVKVSLKSAFSSLKDVTNKSKLQEASGVLTLSKLAELELGVYSVLFEVETAKNSFNLNSSLKVVDSIQVASATYKIVTTSEFPSSFDKSLDYPQKLQKNLDI